MRRNGEGRDVPPRGPAQNRHQRGLGQARDLPDRRDPPAVELVGGHRPDAPEPLDRQRVEKGQLAVGLHHEQTVGLGHATCHLGEELGPGHPDRDGQTDPLEDVAPQPHGDLGGCARDPSQPADVEERFVDGQPLYQRRRLLEDLEDRLARIRVGRHPRFDHDCSRAHPTGARSSHRRADAVRPGLVAGREHDTPADDHGPSAEARVVSLLD